MGGYQDVKTVSNASELLESFGIDEQNMQNQQSDFSTGTEREVPPLALSCLPTRHWARGGVYMYATVTGGDTTNSQAKGAAERDVVE